MISTTSRNYLYCNWKLDYQPYEIDFIRMLCLELQPEPTALDRCCDYYKRWLDAQVAESNEQTDTFTTPPS